MSLSAFDLLHLTWRSLRSNPLRSTLTLMGVFMGVTAVSATLQVGSISQTVIEQRLAERGAPQITMFPRWQPGRISLQQDDMTYLQQRLPGLKAISASNWGYAREVAYQDRVANPEIDAVSLDYLLTSGSRLSTGRFFTPADFTNYRPVAVIDQHLADQLFQSQDPIGQRIYVDRQPFTVIGIVPTRMNEFAPPEGLLIMSIAFQSTITGDLRIDTLKLRPEQLDDLEALGDRAEALMMQRYPSQSYYVWNNVEDILEQRKILELTAQGLAAVGAISLIVGGIGIANIMIAAVTERTAEIGLRRAIGATRGEIMLQFILEATLLSLLGGTIAITTVHGITVIVADMFQLPYEFEVQTTAIALGSALVVGVGASFLPALRASQLDPVKALRSE